MMTIYSQVFKILFLIFVASIFIGQIDARSNAMEVLEQMKEEHEKKEENFAILQKCQKWNLTQNEQMETLRKELKELMKKDRKFMELYFKNPIPLINIYEALIKKKEVLEKKQKNENNNCTNKWKNCIPKVIQNLVKKKKEIYENVKTLFDNDLDPLVYAAKFCKNIEKNFPHQRINDTSKLCEECQPIAMELFKGIYVFNNLEEDVPLVLYQEEPAEGGQVDTKQGKQQQIVHEIGGNDDEDEASSSNVAFDDEEEENRQKDLQEIDQILASRIERQKAKAKKGRKRMQFVREDLDKIDEEGPEIVEELE